MRRSVLTTRFASRASTASTERCFAPPSGTEATVGDHLEGAEQAQLHVRSVAGDRALAGFERCLSALPDRLAIESHRVTDEPEGNPMTTTTNSIQTTTETSKKAEADGRPIAGRLVRFIAAFVMAATLALAFGTQPSGAINPNQTSAQGVAHRPGQWYGGVNDFWARQFASWGWRYTPPALSWYNSATGWMYQTPCGVTMAEQRLLLLEQPPHLPRRQLHAGPHQQPG